MFKSLTLSPSTSNTASLEHSCLMKLCPDLLLTVSTCSHCNDVIQWGAWPQSSVIFRAEQSLTVQYVLLKNLASQWGEKKSNFCLNIKVLLTCTYAFIQYNMYSILTYAIYLWYLLLWFHSVLLVWFISLQVSVGLS